VHIASRRGWLTTAGTFLIWQHDFFGPKERPRCDAPRREAAAAAAAAAAGQGGGALSRGLPSCGRRNHGLALLNIGLTYLRSSPGGGVFAVINGTWARFLSKLGEPPARPAHLHGSVDSQQLIDQPFMRAVLNELAVADRTFSPHKRGGEWAVVPGDAAPVYAAGSGSCALGGARACEQVAEERRKTAFLSQTVQPRPAAGASRAPVAERVALAPDWLFGRGCLTHIGNPQALLQRAASPRTQTPSCAATPTAPGRSTLAPGPAAGLLVATHFVYSMALKRKRAFRAFGWDLADTRNRTADGRGCFGRSDHGILFGHTFFDQTADTKSILCALPASDAAPGCPCCAGLGTLKGQRTAGQDFTLRTTAGRRFGNRDLFNQLEGCADYQAFWD